MNKHTLAQRLLKIAVHIEQQQLIDLVQRMIPHAVLFDATKHKYTDWMNPQNSYVNLQFMREDKKKTFKEQFFCFYDEKPDDYELQFTSPKDAALVEEQLSDQGYTVKFLKDHRCRVENDSLVVENETHRKQPIYDLRRLLADVMQELGFSMSKFNVTNTNQGLDVSAHYSQLLPLHEELQKRGIKVTKAFEIESGVMRFSVKRPKLCNN